MNKAHILVVEDDPLQRRLIKENLEGEGYLVFDASNGTEAQHLAELYPLDIAVVDFKLEKETGTDVIEELLKKNPLITPLVVTAFGNIEHAVDAIKKGAYDYIVKPLDFEKFLLVIERALERQRLKKEISRLKSSLEDKFSPKNFIHTSPRMQEVAALIGRASQSGATVLLTGETGTGKDLVARTIHFASPRKDGPFLAVNIPSLPESLVESELFGAEKGAFTGAGERRIGKFEAAAGGTLYLDEIGDLPSHLQVKLLRFLQEKEFYRLGSSKPLRSDVRIVAATNRDLEKMIHEDSFRSDLFYRLNVIRIHVPPMRERREDIPPLVDHIVTKIATRENKTIDGISAEAMNRLLQYSYPGNIRELENILERAIVMSDGGTLSTRDLPLFVRETAEKEETDPGDLSLTEKIARLEKIEIRRALKASGGVKSKAARALGITERMLRYKMDNLGLTDK